MYLIGASVKAQSRGGTHDRAARLRGHCRRSHRRAGARIAHPPRRRALPVLLRPGRTGSLDALAAVVFGLKTRVIPARRAGAAFGRATDAMEQRGARQVFYKYCATFNSTPRGNIGPCADLLMERRAAEFTLFSPAFPEVSRTVYQGHLFAGDLLISNSPKLRPLDADARAQPGEGAAAADPPPGSGCWRIPCWPRGRRPPPARRQAAGRGGPLRHRRRAGRGGPEGHRRRRASTGR